MADVFIENMWMSELLILFVRVLKITTLEVHKQIHS